MSTGARPSTEPTRTAVEGFTYRGPLNPTALLARDASGRLGSYQSSALATSVTVMPDRRNGSRSRSTGTLFAGRAAGRTPTRSATHAEQ